VYSNVMTLTSGNHGTLTDGLQQRVRGSSWITPDIREDGQEQFGTDSYMIATIPDSTDMIVLYRPLPGRQGYGRRSKTSAFLLLV
jgi:hypothetical protein